MSVSKYLYVYISINLCIYKFLNKIGKNATTDIIEKRII